MLCTARRIAAHQLRGRIAQPLTSPVAFFSPAALRRLASTLAVLEQKEGKLNHGSLSAITAAQKVGGPVHGFVAGSNIKAVADEAATADGVEKILAVDNGAYDKVIHRPWLWNSFKRIFFEDPLWLVVDVKTMLF